MEKIIEVSEMFGLKNLIGWSIVFQRMLLIVFGVSFSSVLFRYQGMKHLQKMDFLIGKKQWRDLESMLVQLVVRTTKRE